MNVKLVIFSLFALLFATNVLCQDQNATDTIKLHVFISSSKWWIAVNPQNATYDTIAIEVREASSPRWQPAVPNKDWGYYMLASDSGTGFSMPLSFRFTATNGQRVVTSAVMNSISQNDLIDTGVQYPVKTDSSSSEEPTAAPTAAPTDAPITTPTDAPATQAPTNAPATQAPTNAPATQAPTDAPATQAPTNAPATQAPATQAPTNAPATQAPTQAPTDAPATQAPQRPTQAATQAPTQAATQAPTKAPTQAPTQAATQKPTQPATQAPTQAATQKPTQAPTQAATQAPTQAATKAPTTPPTTSLCGIVPAAQEPLKIMVPLYVYPGAAWDLLATAAATGVKIIAIINPNSGPNAAGPDASYTSYISKLKNAGVELVGYVHTSWGARDISIIKSEVDTYANKYPGLSGIFFDEGATEASQIPYYSTAYNYVLGKSGYSHVILNPGLEPDSGYSAVSTNIVVYENYASSLASTTFGSWVTCAPTTAAKSGYQYKFTGIVHTAALANMPALAAQVRAKGMGYVYVTDGLGGCCTYNTLTTYFTAEAASVKAINLA